MLQSLISSLHVVGKVPFNSIIKLVTKFNDIFGGINGNIKGIGYDFRASYAMTSNMPLFLNDSTQNYLRFKTIYDTLNIVSLKGTLDFKMIKKMSQIFQDFI
jgi:hypothetical protein